MSNDKIKKKMIEDFMICDDSFIQHIYNISFLVIINFSYRIKRIKCNFFKKFKVAFFGQK